MGARGYRENHAGFRKYLEVKVVVMLAKQKMQRLKRSERKRRV
jgi:hypothetical protein